MVEDMKQSEEAEAEEETRGRRRRREREDITFEDLAEAYLEKAKGVVPEDFVSHMRSARKEFLLAFRSLLDVQIDKLEDAEQRKSSRRPTRVKID